MYFTTVEGTLWSKQHLKSKMVSFKFLEADCLICGLQPSSKIITCLCDLDYFGFLWKVIVMYMLFETYF